MAAGIRSLLAFWLGGASAGTATAPPPPPPPPAQPEALSGGWRLTPEQLARLRGDPAADRRQGADAQSEPEPDKHHRAGLPLAEPVRRGETGRARLPLPAPTLSAEGAAHVQALAEADLSRRQALEAAAHAEEEALVVLLALLEEL